VGKNSRTTSLYDKRLMHASRV